MTIPAWDRPQYPSIKTTAFPYSGKGGKATLPAGSISPVRTRDLRIPDPTELPGPRHAPCAAEPQPSTAHSHRSGGIARPPRTKAEPLTRVSMQSAVRFTAASATRARCSRLATTMSSIANLKYPKPLTVPPIGPVHKSTCIFLHGLGDSGEGWAAVAPLLGLQLPFTRWVFPTAPEVRSWSCLHDAERPGDGTGGVLASRHTV